jgi:hypothetical protein
VCRGGVGRLETAAQEGGGGTAAGQPATALEYLSELRPSIVAALRRVDAQRPEAAQLGAALSSALRGGEGGDGGGDGAMLPKDGATPHPRSAQPGALGEGRGGAHALFSSARGEWDGDDVWRLCSLSLSRAPPRSAAAYLSSPCARGPGGVVGSALAGMAGSYLLAQAAVLRPLLRQALQAVNTARPAAPADALASALAAGAGPGAAAAAAGAAAEQPPGTAGTAG